MSRDIILKLQVLYNDLYCVFFRWKEETWNIENLDDVVCCSGKSTEYPCGCMGTTYREQLEQHLELYREHRE